ncbi:MAG: hypothetical protein ACRYGP_15425 [Janthinobacterium lividum]
MSAKAMPLGRRSPENMTPGTDVSSRVVATSISTRLVPGAVAATGIRTPCGRLAQPDSIASRAKLQTTGQGAVDLGSLLLIRGGPYPIKH